MWSVVNSIIERESAVASSNPVAFGVCCRNTCILVPQRHKTTIKTARNCKTLVIMQIYYSGIMNTAVLAEV